MKNTRKHTFIAITFASALFLSCGAQATSGVVKPPLAASYSMFSVSNWFNSFFI